MPAFIYPFSNQEEKAIQNQFGETVLHYAAKRGYNSVVIKLLRIGANVNEIEINGNTALHLALQNRQVVTAAVLISHKAEVNLKNDDEYTPLHYAVETGSYCLVMKLLNSGAKINEKNKNGDTALHLALKARQPKICDLLIHNNIVQNVANGNGETVLQYAALYNYHDVTLQLLKRCFLNIDAQDVDGNTALHYASMKGHLKIAQLLLAHNASCALSNNKGRTVLHYTAKNNYLQIIYHQLSNVCDINRQDQDGNTALHLAVVYQNIRLVKVLVNNGALFNIENVDNVTAFDYAFRHNCTELLEIFLSKNINQQNKDGNTLLHLAVKRSKEDILNTLLYNHANLYVRNKNKESLLHTAVQTGSYRLCKKLILLGIDLNGQDVNGNTPLHLALILNYTDIAELLVTSAAIDSEVDLTNAEGNCVLHYIAGIGHEELLTRILAKIPLINLQNNDGKTPLHIAVKHSCWNVAVILIMYNADVRIKDNMGQTALDVINSTDNNRLILNIINNKTSS